MGKLLGKITVGAALGAEIGATGAAASLTGDFLMISGVASRIGISFGISISVVEIGFGESSLTGVDVGLGWKMREKFVKLRNTPNSNLKM